ncbi:MAG: NAD(P)H-dependent glycerol-3-phosphate dehydrogenase [Porticoccaceae bacterium]
MVVPTKIAVLGGGSFGTAIANMVAGNRHEAVLWMRDAAYAAQCQAARSNPRYLPDYPLEPNLSITADLAAALAGARVVFFSVPTAAFRAVAQLAAPHIAAGTVVISTAKGFAPEGFTRMSEVLAEELPGARIGVISGPNLAREVARHAITATVIASADPEVCALVQSLLVTPYFRVYANPDVFGVELAGALKNIYAIEAGMATQMGLGQNTMAVLLTRSLAEMTRFAATLGANPMTFLGLGGVGDLFVTCTSPLSRNFRIGRALAAGEALEAAVAAIGQVAEGINTTRIVKHKADELGVYMPLASALHAVLFEGRSISRVLAGMAVSERTDDVEFRVG